MTPNHMNSPPPRTLRRRAVRVVAVVAGHASAEDLVLDLTEATERFGADVAALIFDDQRPGAADVTYCTAALRYGAAAAALIFPAVAGGHAPTVTDDNDETAVALPLVDRVVS